MILVKEVKDTKNVKLSTNHIVDCYDLETKIKLRKKFNTLVREGTILSDFDDNMWSAVSYDGKNHKIKFNISDQIMEYLKKHCILRDDFIEYLKYYCLLSFNKRVVVSIQKHIATIINVTDISEAYSKLPEILLEKGKVELIEKWLNWISFEADEFISDLYNISVDKKKGRRRVLADFQTYFVFNDLIEQYWNESSINEKKYYYPLRLFWIITMILPLRVVEFTVTPYDCIKNPNNQWYLTIRRLTTKGQSNYIHNNLDDFKTFTYEVPEEIALAIKEYQTILKLDGYDEFQKSEDRLFSTSLMQDNYPVTLYKDLNRYFNTSHLNILKNRMINDIIVDRYHYKIRTNEEINNAMNSGYIEAELDDNEITYWKCGDTRHLAMINLIMRGCSPMLIKEFAGHTQSEMSVHYYGNAYKMIRASLFRERASKRVVDIPHSYNLPDLNLGHHDLVRCPGGYCKSKNYILGSGIDCLKYDSCSSCEFLKIHQLNEEDHRYYAKRIQEEFGKILKLVIVKDVDIRVLNSAIQNLIAKQNQYVKALNDTCEV